MAQQDQPQDTPPTADADSTPQQDQPQQQPPANGGRRGNGNGNGNKSAQQQAEDSFGTHRAPNTVVQDTGGGGISDEDYQAEMEKARQAAEERDTQSAIKRGASPQEVQNYEENTLWLIDNKADDRVALHERDPKHPMGEVLFGAGVPRRAFLTPRVQELIQNGTLMPCPEPKRTIVIFDEDSMQEREIPNPKYPDQNVPDPGMAQADQPGRPTRLGRDYIDTDYFEEEQMQQLRQKQAQLPTYVPLAPGGTVPPEVQKENEEFMAQQRAMGRVPRR